MSRKRFIELLQALLTMVDPESPASVACVKTALDSILGLAKESGKSDPLTIHTMEIAADSVNFLVEQREDFAGKPGDYSGNLAKQNRLEQMIVPTC